MLFCFRCGGGGVIESVEVDSMFLEEMLVVVFEGGPLPVSVGIQGKHEKSRCAVLCCACCFGRQRRL